MFPQNGAAAAPNLQGVVFAVAPNPLPTNWYFYVTHLSGTTTLTTLGTGQIGFLATPLTAADGRSDRGRDGRGDGYAVTDAVRRAVIGCIRRKSDL